MVYMYCKQTSGIGQSQLLESVSPYSLLDGGELFLRDEVYLVQQDDIRQAHLPQCLIQCTIWLHRV